MTITNRHQSLGIKLSDLPTPKCMYMPDVMQNGTLYLSEQGTLLEDGTLAKGVVGRDVTAEEAKFLARRRGLVLVAAAQNILDSLDMVERVVNVLGILCFAVIPSRTFGFRHGR